MRALLFGIGSAGDVFPFLALGKGLRERGWRVTIAASPVHASAVARASCGFEPMGSPEDYDRLTSNPDLWKPRHGIRVILGDAGAADMVRRQRDLAREFVSGPGRAVVVASSLAFGARVAREQAGFPLVTAHLAPVVLRCRRQPPVITRVFPEGLVVRWLPGLAYRLIDRRIADPLMAPLVEPLRGESGLAATGRYLDGWWNSPDRVLLAFPRWFGSPPSLPPQAVHAGFLFHDDAGRGDDLGPLHRFLADGPPPVAVTLGSAMRHGREILERVLQACVGLGRRLLILSKDPSQVPAKLPPAALHVGWAPMGETLPRCAALIHHGGVGTLARAFQAGIPQIVVPFCHDQPDNSERVTRLGAGRWIGPGAVLKGRLGPVMRSVLGDSDMRDRCHALAREIDPKVAIDKACAIVGDARTV